MAISTYARKLLLQQLGGQFANPVMMSLTPWMNGIPSLAPMADRINWMAPKVAILDQLVGLLDAGGQLSRPDSDFFVAFAAIAGVDTAALRELQIALDPSTSPLTLLGAPTVNTLKATLSQYELDRGFHHADQKNAAQRAVTERMIRAEAPRWAHHYLQALNWVPEHTGDDQELTGDYVEIAKGHMRDWLQLVRTLAPKESAPTAPFDDALAELRFARQVEEIGASAQSQGVLQQQISKYTGAQKLMSWSMFLGTVRRMVCLVRSPHPAGHTEGTGFLVGPDLVLTNHHVISGAQQLGQKPALWFDYFETNSFEVVELADDWLVTSSEGAFNDTKGDDDDATGWPEDKLDFALLRLKEPANRLFFKPMKRQLTDGPLEPNHYRFREGEGLVIFQHPKGAPLSLASHPSGLVKVLPGGTRWAHLVDTDGGSSGAPIFTLEGKLVALHNSEHPARDRRYNRGVPLWRIRAALEADPETKPIADAWG